MGLFNRKPTYGDYQYEITYRKCVGYFAGKIEYFWGVKKITEIKEKGKGYDFYRADVPKEYAGLPVRVILGGALKSAPPINLYGSNIVAISCNQGTPYGGPFVKLGIGDNDKWQGAIFTFDETDPMFEPLAFDPSDITYGMIATYWTEGVYRRNDHEYTEWLKEQLRGDGKNVSHNNNGLYKFHIFKKGNEPDWNSQRRFLVKDADALSPLAFKCMEEVATETYLSF